MDSINKLTELFRKFPGIGPRQAKRFVYFLLTQHNGYSTELSKLIGELNHEVMCCGMCYRFFPRDKSDSSTCHICRDIQRDKTTLMIVSRDVDFESIEKTKLFNGYYFILGGSLSVLEDEPEKKIRQKELLTMIEKRVREGLKEIIVALDYNPEGEHTRDHVVHLLGPLIVQFGLKLSSLGRGLSTGSELEYTDSDTIKNALNNRQ